MKLFKTFQKSLALIGITSNTSANLFDFGRKCLAYAILWSGFFLSWSFIIWEVNNFIEYTITIYIASAITALAICFTILVYKTEKIFKFINGCERVINNLCDKTNKNGKLIKTKFKTEVEISNQENFWMRFFLFPVLISMIISEEMNRQMEKWSKIAYIVVAVVIPIVWMMPNIIRSLVIYLYTDLGSEAFELPYAIEWYT